MTDTSFTSLEAARRARMGVDPNRVGHHVGKHDEATGHGEGGPASKRIIVAYGFWLFLMTDIVMFSAFFAAYAVLVHAYAGGPTGARIFEVPRVAWETAFLLISSFISGMAAVAMRARSKLWTQVALLFTGIFGLAFLVLEMQEFAQLIGEGAGPQRSAFLSAFFAVVGCHGLHVAAGLLWLGTMMAQIYVKGFMSTIQRRMMCFLLFWHTLDIIWVALFTTVYLLGAAQ
jgi:cytochrome o ubiquinol oxidase subunit 3